MGVGSMMAGGNPASGKQEDRGFYATPWEATEALCRVERFNGTILEPCCGNWALAAVLEKHGYKVVGSDIHPLDPRGKTLDFLKMPVKPLPNINIITNPPFYAAIPMIEHALSFGAEKVVFLHKATFWHAVRRLPFFEQNKPAWIYPLTWRLDFKGLKKPVMECSWYVWHRGNTEYPRYRPLVRPLEIAEAA